MLLLTLFLLGTTATTCSWDRVSNRFHNALRLKTLTGLSLAECKKACCENEKCKSINYATKNPWGEPGYCFLEPSIKYSSSTTFRYSKDFDYYEKQVESNAEKSYCDCAQLKKKLFSTPDCWDGDGSGYARKRSYCTDQTNEADCLTAGSRSHWIPEGTCSWFSSETSSPTSLPTTMPTTSPTEMPSETPSEMPSEMPSKEPSMSPTEEPSMTPTYEPSLPPTEKPTPGLCNEDIRSELESLSCRSQIAWDSSLQNGRLNKMCMCVNEIDGATFMEDNTYDCKYNAFDTYTIASVFSNCAEAVNSCSYWETENENAEFKYAEWIRGVSLVNIRTDSENGCQNSFQNGGPRCLSDVDVTTCKDIDEGCVPASRTTCVDFPTMCIQGDYTTCKDIDEGCVFNYDRKVCMVFPTTCAEANIEGIIVSCDDTRIKDEDCYKDYANNECKKIPETCAEAEDDDGCTQSPDTCIWGGKTKTCYSIPPTCAEGNIDTCGEIENEVCYYSRDEDGNFVCRKEPETCDEAEDVDGCDMIKSEECYYYYEDDMFSCRKKPETCIEAKDRKGCKFLEDICEWNRDTNSCDIIPLTCAEGNRSTCDRITNEECYKYYEDDMTFCRKKPETCTEAEDFKGCRILGDSCVWSKKTKTCYSIPATCAEGNSETCEKIENEVCYDGKDEDGNFVCRKQPEMCDEAWNSLTCARVQNQECYYHTYIQESYCRQIPETCTEAQDEGGCMRTKDDRDCAWNRGPYRCEIIPATCTEGNWFTCSRISNEDCYQYTDSEDNFFCKKQPETCTDAEDIQGCRLLKDVCAWNYDTKTCGIPPPPPSTCAEGNEFTCDKVTSEQCYLHNLICKKIPETCTEAEDMDDCYHGISGCAWDSDTSSCFSSTSFDFYFLDPNGCDQITLDGDCNKFNGFKQELLKTHTPGKCPSSYDVTDNTRSFPMGGNDCTFTQTSKSTTPPTPSIVESVEQCSTNKFGIDFCNDWCNTNGFWGCGVAKLGGNNRRNTDNLDYTCSCSGCNGCGSTQPTETETSVGSVYATAQAVIDSQAFDFAVKGLAAIGVFSTLIWAYRHCFADKHTYKELETPVEEI